MNSAAVNGIVMYYDDIGSGSPVVLVHGHPFDRTMWQPQIQALRAAGFRAVAPDLRGYGQSSVTPACVTLDVFAADIEALMRHLELESVVVAGLSMGGQVAMELAKHFPERLAGLVLADTAPQAETYNGKRARYELADRLLREGMSAYAEEVLPKMLAPQNLAALPAVASQVLGMIRSTPAEGAAAGLRGRAQRPDYCQGLSSLDLPTLIVVGSDEELTTIDDARLLYELISHAELVVIDGAGHMPNLERDKEFNSALLSFLRSLA